MDINLYMQRYRNLIYGVDTLVPIKNGMLVKAINFDNAATTPPLVPVIKEIVDFAPWYSSVHRGTGYKSKLSSYLFEESRKDVLNFVNGDPEKSVVIYVKNSTEAINMLSYTLCDGVKKCVVLSTSMEHHSNDLPWREKFNIDYIELDCNGKASIDDLEYKLKKYNGSVKLVTVAGASNVTGHKNPIHKIAEIAHKYNAQICVDGAQLVPHSPINMRPENPAQHIDYIVFSAHKMYAPFGAGVLIGPKKTFEKGSPAFSGGGTVRIVTHKKVLWEDPPSKEEAGTPNLMGVFALTRAIKTINMIGIENIERYEQNLTEYALEKLKSIPEIKLYGNTKNANEKVGIIPFNIEGIYHRVVAEILSDEAGIAVRNGCFCAEPYVQKLLNIGQKEIDKHIKNPTMPRPGMVRISFGFYNSFEEIDTLIQTLTWICQNKDLYT